MASTIEPESEPADEDTVLRERPPTLGAGGAAAEHPVADVEVVEDGPLRLVYRPLPASWEE